MISANEATVLQVDAFSTEEDYDELYVNDNAYSGTVGPVGERMEAGDTVSFSSDDSMTRTGFLICGTSPTGETQTSNVARMCELCDPWCSTPDSDAPEPRL